MCIGCDPGTLGCWKLTRSRGEPGGARECIQKPVSYRTSSTLDDRNAKEARKIDSAFQDAEERKAQFFMIGDPADSVVSSSSLTWDRVSTVPSYSFPSTRDAPRHPSGQCYKCGNQCENVIQTKPELKFKCLNCMNTEVHMPQQ